METLKSQIFLSIDSAFPAYYYRDVNRIFLLFIDTIFFVSRKREED